MASVVRDGNGRKDASKFSKMSSRLIIRCRDLQAVEHLRKEGVQVEAHPYLPYAYQIHGFDHLGELASFQNGEFSCIRISVPCLSENLPIRKRMML